MAILPKAIDKFCTSLWNFWGHPSKTEKIIIIIILKFTQKHNRLKIAKAILSKDDTAGEMTLPNFNLHYRAIETNGAGDQQKNRFTDQWTGIEGSEMPDTHRRKDSIFNKWCQDIGYQHGAWNSILSSHPTQNSHQVKGLSIRHDTLTLLKKKWGRLQYTGTARLSEQTFLGIPCLQSVYSRPTGELHTHSQSRGPRYTQCNKQNKKLERRMGTQWGKWGSVDAGGEAEGSMHDQNILYIHKKYQRIN